MMKANPRHHAYHSPKARLVGSRGVQVPPAWKATNIPAAAAAAQQAQTNVRVAAATGALPGAGRILISNLPVDVMLEEVVDLLRKTVGMTKEAFMCHDERGRPLGIAIIAFTNPAHAAAARARFNRKVIDQRRELRVELVYDSDPPALVAASTVATSTAPPKPRSLLDRIAGTKGAQKNNATNATAGPSRPSAINQTLPMRPSTKFPAPTATPASTSASRSTPIHTPRTFAFAPTAHASSARQRLGRTKKGPKRVRKFLTVADLDQEMDEYNARRDAVVA